MSEKEKMFYQKKKQKQKPKTKKKGISSSSNSTINPKLLTTVTDSTVL